MRTLRRALAALVALLLLAGGSVAAILWSTLPARDERLQVAGLSAPVTVTLDSAGIPRIRASGSDDAATALGYLHARDRLAQMELMRRAASGRLAELIGPSALPYDRMMRVLGLQHLAAADAAALAPDARALFEAYARGVNAWIAERGRRGAPETLLLGQPVPWRVSDSLLWGRLLALWLSGNYRVELTRLSLAGRMPMTRVLSLWPAIPGDLPADAPAPDTTQLPGATPRHAAAAGALLAALPAFPAPFAWPDEASQEWALDGRHTATGAPMLAGDPHLALGFPGMWYLARIDTPQGELAGATAPGLPLLVLGHNGRIAWSFTTASADTEDLFEETVLPDGRYATPDGPAAFATRVERIAVRGRVDELLSVRSTRHGPVISDLDAPPAGASATGPVLALQAEALGPLSAAAGLLALDRAGDVAAAGRAAALIATPVQNLLVADRAGIALFTTGRVPLRRAGDGSVSVAGADGAHDWIGEASGTALPHFVAPAGGRLVNANESTVGPGFPVLLDRDSAPGWRAQRIRERLDELAASGDRASLEDLAAMQVDDRSTLAVRLLPVLRGVTPLPGPSAPALALLQGWDGWMRVDAPQPLLFDAWMQRLAGTLLARQGAGPGQGGAWEDVVAAALTPADPAQGTAWCGLPGCAAMLAETLDATTRDLAARFGDAPAAWRWGEAHQAMFANPLLEHLPLLGWLTTHHVPVRGDDATLFRGGSGVPGDLAARHGAAYRGVYDLAALDRSRFIVAPGESGNLLSGFSWNLLDAWARGATITLGPTPDRVTATIRLTP